MQIMNVHPNVFDPHCPLSLTWHPIREPSIEHGFAVALYDLKLKIRMQKSWKRKQVCK